MVLLVKCLQLSLSAAVLLSLGGGIAPRGASAMGLPPPPPTVNFSIAVQGVVWCSTCRYRGYYPPMDASPLEGAVAYLQCRHGRRRAATSRAVTNRDGYFRIETSQLTAFTSDECKVHVPRSPVRACGVPAYPGGGKGLPLNFEEFVKRGDGLQGLYSVGNFLFRPENPRKCY